MRTTLTLDDRLADMLREYAHRERKTFKEVVNEALQRGLAILQEPPAPRKFEVKPFAMGEPMPGINLDKALALADALEDEETLRELEQGR